MTIVACIKRSLHFWTHTPGRVLRAGDCAKCAPAYWVSRLAVDFGAGGLI